MSLVYYFNVKILCTQTEYLKTYFRLRDWGFINFANSTCSVRVYETFCAVAMQLLWWWLKPFYLGH